MKATAWLFVSPFVLVSLSLGALGVAVVVSACGDDPLYACPDPSQPCFPIDAGADADAGD